MLTSADGIHFERPSLGLVEAEGHRYNNILLRGYVGHNFCVFLDSQAPPEQRFKAVGGSSKNNLHGFSSADGLQWMPVCEARWIFPAPSTRSTPCGTHTRAAIASSVAIWTKPRARYPRHQAAHPTTSSTGAPIPHRYADGVPLEHFYTNATVPCPGAEHILLSFPMRFVPELRKDIAGWTTRRAAYLTVFMTSRNGTDWDRTFMSWLRPGPDRRNWTHRNQTLLGIVATAPDEWSLYASSHYGWSSNCLQRLTYAPGVSPHLTPAIVAANAHEAATRWCTLHLNYATSAVGSIRVEVLNAEGAAIEGFALEDAEPLYGDALDAPWPTDFSALQGQIVRLRFVSGRRPVLYSFDLSYDLDLPPHIRHPARLAALFPLQSALYGNWQTAYRQLQHMDADLLPVGGDLTRDGSIHDFELAKAKEEFDALPYPYYAIPGNMDTGNKPTAIPGATGRDDPRPKRHRRTLDNCPLFRSLPVDLRPQRGPLHRPLRGDCWLGLAARARMWDFLENCPPRPLPSTTSLLMHYALFVDALDEPSWDITKEDEYHSWHFTIDNLHRQRLFAACKKTGVEIVSLATSTAAAPANRRWHSLLPLRRDRHAPVAGPLCGRRPAPGLYRFDVSDDGIRDTFIPLAGNLQPQEPTDPADTRSPKNETTPWLRNRKNAPFRP